MSVFFLRFVLTAIQNFSYLVILYLKSFFFLFGNKLLEIIFFPYLSDYCEFFLSLKTFTLNIFGKGLKCICIFIISLNIDQYLQTFSVFLCIYFRYTKPPPHTPKSSHHDREEGRARSNYSLNENTTAPRSTIDRTTIRYTGILGYNIPATLTNNVTHLTQQLKPFLTS